jgi:hypothetical protein
MTSSTLISNEFGTMRPSALAVFKLTTSLNRVGCSMGRSAGLTPFSTLSRNRQPCGNIRERPVHMIEANHAGPFPTYPTGLEFGRRALLRLPAPAVVGFASGIDLTAGGRESVLNRYR